MKRITISNRILAVLMCICFVATKLYALGAMESSVGLYYNKDILEEAGITVPEAVLSNLEGRQGEMILGVRGEDIKLDPQNLSLYEKAKMQAAVENTEVMGNENNLYFTFGGAQSVARVSKYETSHIGDTIEFVFSLSEMHFFDKESEVCYV